MTQASLVESRVLYTARCSSCHNVVVPKEYPMDEWKKIMKKMAPKAKLNEEDKEKIWRYIVTANAVPN